MKKIVVLILVALLILINSGCLSAVKLSVTETPKPILSQWDRWLLEDLTKANDKMFAQSYDPEKQLTRAELAYIVFCLDPRNVADGHGPLDKETVQKIKDSYPEPVPFKDTQNHWAKYIIDCVSQGSIVFGFSDLTFKPNILADQGDILWTLAELMDSSGLLRDLFFRDQVGITTKLYSDMVRFIVTSDTFPKPFLVYNPSPNMKATLGFAAFTFESAKRIEFPYP